VLVVLLRRAPGRRELAILGVLLGGALLWVLEVAVMTSDGFSGNLRYLVLPAAILWLAAGVGAGWAARAVLGRRATAGAAGVALAVALGALFGAPAVGRLPADIRQVTYEARLNDNVDGLIARAGGPALLRACGDLYTGPFQVPVVAWYMHVHTTLVASTRPIRPAVVFRVRSRPESRPGPSLRSVGDPSDLRNLSLAPGWRIVGVCRRGPAA
jgi:hypothetical protein